MKDFSKFQPDREIAEYLLDAFTIQNADQVHEQTVQIIEQQLPQQKVSAYWINF